MAKKDKKEGNVFDKIFKENAKDLFIPIVEKQLGIQIKYYESLPEKLQRTLEREMDFFFKIKTVQEEEFLLHIEFQTQSEPHMIYRISEYHAMALRQYKMEIRHVVIYLGRGKTTMSTSLTPNQVFSSFELINIHAMDPERFLSSQVPEVILLAILSKFEQSQVEEILQKLLDRLLQVVSSPKALKKYFTQLTFIARLRKLESQTEEKINQMPVHYDINTDGLYLKGVKKGIEKELIRNIKKLLESSIATEEKIAEILNVPLEKVLQIKKGLSRKK